MNNLPRYGLSPKHRLIELNEKFDAYIEWVRNYSGLQSEVHLSHLEFMGHIPSAAIDLLVLEDHRFFHHGGIDFWAIPRGVRRYIQFGRIGGVSTIDQQLVRTINKRRERTISRKAGECFYAFLLNRHFSKIELLEAYLSTIYLGPHLYGFGTASEFLFGRSLNDLSRKEVGLLACMPPYPVTSAICGAVRKNGPFSCLESLMQVAEIYSPAWSRKIKRRLSYLERRREKHQKDVSEAILSM